MILRLLKRLIDRVIAFFCDLADIKRYGNGSDDRGELCERDSEGK